MCSPFDVDEIECRESFDLFEAIGEALAPIPRIWCDHCAHSIPEAELVDATTYRPENKVCPACYSEGWIHIGEDDES